MTSFQVRLEPLRFPRVEAFTEMPSMWPAVESAHFIGLTLLPPGSFAAWDLRLLGPDGEPPGLSAACIVRSYRGGAL
jgi:hypothetical protein